jgi:hypothetical protein
MPPLLSGDCFELPCLDQWHACVQPGGSHSCFGLVEATPVVCHLQHRLDLVTLDNIVLVAGHAVQTRHSGFFNGIRHWHGLGQAKKVQ